MKNETRTTPDIRSLLLWCRENGFAVSEVEADGVTLTLADTRIYQGLPVPKSPRTAHEAWAQTLGVPVPVDDDEPDEVEPS